MQNDNIENCDEKNSIINSMISQQAENKEDSLSSLSDKEISYLLNSSKKSESKNSDS